MQVFLFPISLFPEILWVSSTRVLREQQNKYVFPRRIRMTFIETIFTASCNSFQILWVSSTRVLREQQNKYVFPRRIRMTFIETIFTASCNSFQDKQQQMQSTSFEQVITERESSV